MSKQIKHISHKLIDTLSDGVFSIALTLLGLDVVGLVHKISESEDFNGAMFDNWPTFLAYVLGFVVLFSWWYQYHVTSQYVVGTNGNGGQRRRSKIGGSGSLRVGAKLLRLRVVRHRLFANGRSP